MISNKQKKLIHTTARKLGLIDKFGDEHYRMVLRSICNVSSSLELDQIGFDKLMAFFSSLGATPLKNLCANINTPTSRQRWLINNLLAQLPELNLAGVISKITNGDCNSIDELTRYQASKVISALIDIKARYFGQEQAINY